MYKKYSEICGIDVVERMMQQLTATEKQIKELDLTVAKLTDELKERKTAAEDGNSIVTTNL